MSYKTINLEPNLPSGSKAFTQESSDGVSFNVAEVSQVRPPVRIPGNNLANATLDARKVASLWTRGIMPHEIAEVMDVSVVIVEELLRSEDFTLEVNSMLATRELLDLEKALETTSVEALVCLRDLMKNGSNEAVRVKAATYLIDQYRGKAPQHIKISGGKSIEDPKSEAERLRKQLGYTQ